LNHHLSIVFVAVVFAYLMSGHDSGCVLGQTPAADYPTEEPIKCLPVFGA
jgi:hypothetical protein